MFNGFGDARDIQRIVDETGRAFDVRTHFHDADMSKPEQIRDLVRTTQNVFGSLDILVNNAGIQVGYSITLNVAEQFSARCAA